MADRRHLQRFDLDIPVLLTAVPNGCECSDKLLVTRDISAAGAFFDTTRPLAQGCELSFELQLPGRNRPGGRVQLKGTVVRCTPAGMAVSFDDDYR
ncbi:MAG: PilZ domain-containing protein, partial [Pseudomonadota bacterium]|nr:PilZ domain-containing protein [Pseudomonadota bacterium]